MIMAIAKVMALQTLRDRGAIALVFILPPMIFLIFATIFSGTGGSDTNLNVAVVDLVGTQSAAKLKRDIENLDGVLAYEAEISDRQAAVRLVEGGSADNAVIIVAAPTGRGSGPSVEILSNAGTQMTGSILNGQLQQLLAQEFPSVAIRRTAPVIDQLAGGLTPTQSQTLEERLKAIESGSAPSVPTFDDGSDELVEMTLVGGTGSGEDIVSYYAGAIAFMFLLFSSMQAAITLIEDRQSSIIDRVAVGPGGIDVLVFGKLVFLTGRGLCQVLLIFVFAWWLYSVAIGQNMTGLILVTFVASLTASSLALFTASACTTRQQANAISSFIVLIFSAIGGSMIPRFMMPQWLQDIGWLTPNAWIIDAYRGMLFRGASFSEVMLPLLPPLCASAVALIGAVYLSRRRLYIS